MPAKNEKQKYVVFYNEWNTFDGWYKPDFCEKCSRAISTAVNAAIVAGRLAQNNGVGNSK